MRLLNCGIAEGVFLKMPQSKFRETLKIIEKKGSKNYLLVYFSVKMRLTQKTNCGEYFSKMPQIEFREFS
jgi:hypothetical protein